VAELISDWLVQGDCRRAIFNLKLPMKKRYAEVCQLRELMMQRLHDAGIELQWRARQLYHDREEITVALVPAN
jgi:23S rRNA (cytidine2498-2'-O)-methyltransferase